MSETEARALWGVNGTLALELAVPFRAVRDRIVFADSSGAPFTPPAPDTHHRNETLARIADVRLGIQAARVAPPWTLTASGGVYLPTGRTESNPFALGRLGLPHQHIQFGHGTVDPFASAAASRRAGKWSLTVAASARLTLAENAHGYRAGDRFGLSVSAAHAFRGGWAARGGLDLAREQAERWSSSIEEEGNLGRTDLFLALGASRMFTGVGTVGVTARLPLASAATGAQADLPLVLQLAWTK